MNKPTRFISVLCILVMMCSIVVAESAGIDQSASKSGPMRSKSNQDIIWEFFKAQGFTDAGVAGILGNIEQESGYHPNNLQWSAEQLSGMTDAQFTAAVDNGTISRSEFISSPRFGSAPNYTYGYGLVQWTYSTRKEGFYDYAKSQGTSIANITTQLNYILREMGWESGLINYLKTVASVSEATIYFQKNYERPGNPQTDKRIAYAEAAFAKYHTHSYSSSITQNATCTNSGIRTYSCTSCGSTYIETISALGHNWGTWGTTTNPTCTANGVSTRTCSRCGQQQNQSIPANGHHYTSETIVPSCTQRGYDLHTCTVCGDQYTDAIIPATGHSFASGICTTCGAVDTAIQKGDINLDGQITSADTVMLARFLIELVELNEAQLAAADLNNDGVVTSADAVLLANHLVYG